MNLVLATIRPSPFAVADQFERAASLLTCRGALHTPPLARLQEAQRLASDALSASQQLTTTAGDVWTRRNAGIAVTHARQGLMVLGNVVMHLTPGVMKPAVYYSPAQLLTMLSNAGQQFRGAATAYTLE